MYYLLYKLPILTCSLELYNLRNFISIQYAFIRAIPIPTPYHIKNKLKLSHSTHSQHCGNTAV